MGWLIVEDLAMVIVLVIVPIFAAREAHESSIASLAATLAMVFGKTLIFGVVALYVGTRFVPWLLMKVTRTGSPELFTLAVLAIALGIAYGSAEAFDVSFALGAFFAGVVLSESALSKRAAADSLPLKDAFAVLFFVSVGMLFDPSMLIRTPLEVLAVVAVIVFGKALVAYAIVRAFRFPPRTALTVSASLAQIGEFSFILAGLGSSLGLLPTQGRDLILASAILSIALNPVLFALIRPLAQRLDPLPDSKDDKRVQAAPVAEADRAPEGRTVIVGFGRVGSVVGSVLEKAGLSFTVIEGDLHVCEALRARNVPVVQGDALNGSILESAGMAGARLLILAIPDPLQARGILDAARRINPGIITAVRSQGDSTSRGSEMREPVWRCLVSVSLRSRWRTTPSRATECRRTLVSIQRECLHRALREVLDDPKLSRATPVRFTRVSAGILRGEFPAAARPTAAELVRDPEPIDQVAGAIGCSPTTRLVCKRSQHRHLSSPKHSHPLNRAHQTPGGHEPWRLTTVVLVDARVLRPNVSMLPGPS